LTLPRDLLSEQIKCKGSEHGKDRRREYTDFFDWNRNHEFLKEVFYENSSIHESGEDRLADISAQRVPTLGVEPVCEGFASIVVQVSCCTEIKPWVELVDDAFEFDD
jgi:hypothetical protein